MPSSTGISFTGLSSNLDTDSIVSALTQAETARKSSLQTKQNNLKLRQVAYTTVKSGLSAVARAAGTLNTSSTYATIQGSVGDGAVATLSTTAAAAVGSYDLDVTALARANKIGSAAQTDPTGALGKAGIATLNGKALKIEATDSLTSLAQKVNGLGAGVTASVVDGGKGRAYLTLSSTSTGAAAAVSVADLEGSALADLGIVGSTDRVRETSGNDAVGFGFSSKSAALGGLLGAPGMGATTIEVGGVSVAVDPATDTLDDLATKINAAGGTATVDTGTKNGATVYTLRISGATGPPTLSDGGGLLKGLGVLRADAANELVAAQDASFTLDGVALTSATNAVTGVIAGATLTLKKEASTSVTLVKDTSAVTNGVKNLVSAANGLFSSIATYSTFDKSTYATGVLFGDSLARQAKESVRGLLFSDSPGVTGSLKNLASVGLGLDETGNVTLDESAFNAALERDPKGVQALLQSVGQGSNESIKYVSATTAARPSPSGSPYGVDVTQAATRASLVAGTAQTGTRTVAETLTFRGAAFGTQGFGVDLEAGTDLAATVAKINADGRLKDLVTASVEDGKLRIDAKKYGTPGEFTLTSNFASTESNSGVGVGGEGTYLAGLNVAGTIAGETATGNGQFLIGAPGNSRAEGLQIQILGAATGRIGTVGYSRGAASRMADLINTFTDSTKGLFSAADVSLQTQIDGLEKDKATIDARIESRTTELKNRFGAMENAIARLKANASTLGSLISSDANG